MNPSAVSLPTQPTISNEQHCTRCGRALKASDTQVWLERNLSTGTYHPDGIVPADDSQGFFPFGQDCALAVIAKGGAR